MLGTEAVTALTDEQVSAYLRSNPDFLRRHPELASVLAPPQRDPGSSRVADLQHYMNERLRRDLDEMRGCAEHLVTTQRINMSLQTRTHQAILAVLTSHSLAELLQVLSDLAELLEVDVITLCFEASDEDSPALNVDGVMRLAVGSIETTLSGHDVYLSGSTEGAESLFGAAASTVRSYALARLRPGEKCPIGVLALGSGDENCFHPGQGTELLMFLTKVMEYAVHRWVP